VTGSCHRFISQFSATPLLCASGSKEIHSIKTAIFIETTTVAVNKKSEPVPRGGGKTYLYFATMRKVTLVFPDVIRLTDFVLMYRVSGLEVRSEDLLLTGILSDQLIKAAIAVYDAELLKLEAKHS